ncbi:MAG: TonB-dependent receptor, partial [Pseudomonadota bacterium]
RFDVTVGGRYSHNTQRADQATGGLPGLFVGPPEVFPTATSSEGVFTWSVAPRLELSDAVALYARVAKGFRPGGPNVISPGAPPSVPTSYASDTAISYEAGVKAETADNVFGLDLSVFYLDWKNIQLFTVVSGFGINANGGGARSIGAEFSASLRPVEGLDLVLNGAYTDAELTVDTDPLVGGFDGDKLPFTPKFAVSFSGDYEWPLSDRTTGFVGGTFRFQTGQYTNFAAGGRNEFPSYGALDLRAGVNFDRFAVELFARNVANSEGLTSGGNFEGTLPAGVVHAGVLRPRTIGVTLTAAF